MKPLNNLKGYCLATFVKDGSNPELSNVVGKPRGEWRVDNPLTIYGTAQELIESVGPGFDKRVHTICEVLIHLAGERVEVL